MQSHQHGYSMLQSSHEPPQPTRWQRLTTVSSQPPTHSTHWFFKAWLISIISVSCLFLVFLALTFTTVQPILGFSPLWAIMLATRALLLICLAAWIWWRLPWRRASLMERRQGRMTNILCVILGSFVCISMLLDWSFYRYPLQTLAYFDGLLLFTMILWLVRHGFVQLGGILLVTGLIQQLLSTGGTAIDTNNLVNPLLFAAIILIGGMLIRPWIAFVLAISLPLTVAGFQVLGLALGTPDLRITFLLILLLIVIASIVWLYARSLERALLLADQRSTELDAAQQALAEHNTQLQTQATELHTAQAELQQTIRYQEQRIAEALAEIQQHSIEVRSIQTPLINVAADMLVAPLVGSWDRERIVDFEQLVLSTVAAQHTKVLLLDVTGLASADQQITTMLHRIVRGCQLLGCRTIVVGIHPEMAQILVHSDIANLQTASNLAAGIQLSSALR